jgi:hypothetical protein
VEEAGGRVERGKRAMRRTTRTDQRNDFVDEGWLKDTSQHRRKNELNKRRKL